MNAARSRSDNLFIFFYEFVDLTDRKKSLFLHGNGIGKLPAVDVTHYGRGSLPAGGERNEDESEEHGSNSEKGHAAATGRGRAKLDGAFGRLRSPSGAPLVEDKVEVTFHNSLF